MIHFIEKTASLLVALFILSGLSLAVAQAQESANTQQVPSMEERMKDVEAYITNSAPSHLKSPGPGHNAWMMVSAVLVLFMTLPGLALFYGGLVRSKNVLSIMAQCLGIAGLVTIMWWAFGYSLVFGTNFKDTPIGPFLGGTEFFFLNDVDGIPNANYTSWVSQNVWCMFQLMFAIITPAVLIGAVVERMKFTAVMLFTGVWLLVVYIPLAHMVWGATGWMNGLLNASAQIKAIDYAGGTVVEMASGYSALILCLILGPRIGYGKIPIAPHSLALCMTGAGLLWVGWYGFNAGSAGAADVNAANAFTTTTLAAAVASFTWAMCEYVLKGKASVLGFCSGAVAGLVCITPACGFITPNASVIAGLLAGVISFYACTKIKSFFGYDDALDVFGVHGVCGTIGLILTGVFATTKANAGLATNLSDYLGKGLIVEQLKAIVVTALLAVVGTTIVALVVKAALGGLRPSMEKEEAGLDIHDHGEQGYVHE